MRDAPEPNDSPFLPIRVAVWAVITRGTGADEEILLIEFDEPNAEQPWHFNLPGGGVEPGESLHEATRREVWEEAGAQVTVGELLFVWDHRPLPDSRRQDRPHVRPVFRCMLVAGSEPHLPAVPDPFQIGVRWVKLSELQDLPLIPPISAEIVQALREPNGRDPLVMDG